MRSGRLAPGTRLGNYRVGEELGVTATGVVYAAEHVVLPRRALLKVASAAMRSNSLPMLREACILEALRHAGLPAVYESGRLPDDRPWFASEAIAGERLSDALAVGPLPPLAVAALIHDVARVLEHAHRRGVIHAGLRPDRLVRTGDRGYGVCVTEWSDARTHDAALAIPHLPTPGARAYLAPEVLRGDAIDDRADVYALGLIAYQALTGALPAAAGVGTVRERCPRAPRELATVIDQMLARDRFDRPSSAEVVAEIGWVTDAAGGPGPLHDLPAIAEVELIAMDDAPADLPRIRKPRWTPVDLTSYDRAGVVAGAIDDDARAGRR